MRTDWAWRERTRKAWLAGIVLALLSGCVSAPDDDGADADSGAPPATVAVDEVCFATQVEPGGGPATMRGMRFAPDNATVAILLLHGAILPGGSWKSGYGGYSLAADLAKAGYAVFVIDRLGYGESPWTGQTRSGAQLTHEVQVATSHDVVQAIRAGAGGVVPAGGGCDEAVADGRTFDRVVYGGHSYGGAMAVMYGARYDDADALIVLMSYLEPLGSRIGLHFTACRTTLAAPDGYTRLMCEDGEAVSPCADFMFHGDGADPRDVGAGCAALWGGRDPLPMATVGSLWPLLREDVKQIPAGLPVLRAAAEHDGVWEDGEATSVREADLATWRSACACAVTDFVQADSGHIWWLHRSAPTLGPAIVAWLEDSGLPP